MINDFIVDLETLGTRHDAAVIQIGAIAFDRHTLEITSEFLIDTTPRKEDSFDFSTLQWWTSPDVIEMFRGIIQNEERYPIDVGVDHLYRWFRKHKSKGSLIYANSPSFDVNKLRYINESLPFPFWLERDIRTIRYDNNIYIEGEPTHNALEDCKHELKVLLKTR